MKTYVQNSPEAMARIVAMMIITDTELDKREIAVLDATHAYERMGLTRAAFMAVARDYCGDLVQLADEKRGVALLDPQLVNSVIDCVTDATKRLLVSRILISVIPADDHQGEGELVLFEHILDRWSLSRDQLALAIREERHEAAAA
jgi:hypothetical protein